MVGAEELFLSVQRIGYIYVLLNFELCSLAFLEMLSQNHPYEVFFKGFIHGQKLNLLKERKFPQQRSEGFIGIELLTKI